MEFCISVRFEPELFAGEQIGVGMLFLLSITSSMSLSLGPWTLSMFPLKAEGRKQKAESRKQKAKGKRQMEKAKGQRSKVKGKRSKVQGKRSKVQGPMFPLFVCFDKLSCKTAF